MLQGSVFVETLQGLSACYDRVAWLRETTSSGTWQDGLREYWQTFRDTESWDNQRTLMWRVVFAEYSSEGSSSTHRALLQDRQRRHHASCEARILATLRLGTKLPYNLPYPIEKLFGDWHRTGVSPNSSVLDNYFLPEFTVFTTFFNQGFASLYKTRFQ
jgi:hypothetical protein